MKSTETIDGKTELETAYRDEKQGMIAWLSTRLDRDEAEDILQDAMTRAFSNLDALEPVRDVVSWLWRAIRNGAIDAWRTRRRRRTDPWTIDDLDRLMDLTFFDSEDEFERAETIESLFRAIESLAPDQREVIVSQCLNGETFKSISERTGDSVETLSARKRRALVRLAEILEYMKGDTV